jgi:hypothetical protein
MSSPKKLEVGRKERRAKRALKNNGLDKKDRIPLVI